MGQWELKEREVRNEGDVEHIDWVMQSVEKGRKKVADTRTSVEHLERARLEDCVGRPRGKGNLQPKVEIGEEEEEKAKGEVENRVMDEKVEGMGMGKSGMSDWLTDFFGSPGGGGPVGLAFGPCCP